MSPLSPVPGTEPRATLATRRQRAQELEAVSGEPGWQRVLWKMFHVNSHGTCGLERKWRIQFSQESKLDVQDCQVP